MNISLKQLEAFVWVSDLGSFRKAAERLNTTQPNISSRISVLETALNVTLLERDAGSVRLTSRGQALLSHARQVLRATEEFVEAADGTSLYDGVLKLGVTELIVHTWLRDYLKTLKEIYPNLLVELTVDLSITVSRELFTRAIDLALQNGPFTQQTTGNEDLGSYPWIWVAAPALLDSSEAAGDPAISARDLARFPVLTHARDTRPYEQVHAHLASFRGLRLVPSSNLAACLQMTVDSMGIAVLPAAMVKSEIEHGQLVQIPYEWSPEDLRFQARYHADKSSRFVAKAAQIAAATAVAYTSTFVTGRR